MGAGFCSLYPKIHYIEVHYIKVWVVHILYYVSTINIFFRLACQFSIIKRRQNNMHFSNSHTTPCFKFKFPSPQKQKANPFQYDDMSVCYCAMRIMEMILSAVWKLSALYKQFWHCAHKPLRNDWHFFNMIAKLGSFGKCITLCTQKLALIWVWKL